MWKKILIGVVVCLGLLVAIGFVLPSDVHVERSTVIQAPRERVFELVSNYKHFNEWSPWAKLDPNTKYTYSGPETGVGAKMAWTSESSNVGTGSQEIVEVKAPELVRTKLDFGEHGISHAFFKLDPADGGTKVVWGFDSDMGANPIGRWFGLMMDGMIGKDYEQGLASLKQVAEGEGK